MGDLIVITRSLEILFAYLAAIFLYWLGFKLFVLFGEESYGDKNPNKKTTLEVQYKKYRLSLKNAGPGIFFALFATAIIIFAVTQKAEYKSENRGKTNSYSKGENDQNGIEEISTLIEKYYNEATEFAQNKEYSQALEIYENLFNALEKYPNVCNRFAWYSMAEKSKINMDSVFKLARISILINPRQGKYYRTLSRAYCAVSRYDSALVYINKAINLDPSKNEYKDDKRLILNRLKHKKEF